MKKNVEDKNKTAHLHLFFIKCKMLLKLYFVEWLPEQLFLAKDFRVGKRAAQDIREGVYRKKNYTSMKLFKFRVQFIFDTHLEYSLSVHTKSHTHTHKIYYINKVNTYGEICCENGSNTRRISLFFFCFLYIYLHLSLIQYYVRST